MVLLGDKKYACETCIKGHRSSSCKHTDRPLFEIKKKGRPVTQCEHCRELRRTKQVHVKCVCEQKDDGEGPSSSSKKGVKNLSASAAFPSGLPPVLGASVALQPPSEGSDSEYASETSTKACMCKADGLCNCCTPRAPRNRRQSKASRKSDREPSDSGSERPHQPAGLVASANTGDYRPVLPRPSHDNRSSPPHSAHSTAGTSHGSRGQLFFSPYSRAYEYAHGAEIISESSDPPAVQQQIPQLLTDPMSQNYPSSGDDVSSFMSDWLSAIQQPNLPPPPPSILCDCGPNCACPGCVVHQGPTAVLQGFASCANPSTCNACLECTMLSLTQNPVVDEWLRQMNAAPNTPPQGSTSSSNTVSPPAQDLFGDVSQRPPSDMRFDPASWQSYALWNNLQGQIAAPSPPEDCCSGQCKCSQGMCSCPADCCGCCQGCSCADCTHEDRSMGTGKTLTFAVSGERGACCGGRKSPGQPVDMPQAGPSSGATMMEQAGYQGGLDLRGIYEFSAPAMDVPRTSLSRASSTSSRSSGQQSHYSSSQGSVHRGPASAPADAPAIRSCCASLATMHTSQTQARTAAVAPSRSPIPYPAPPTAVRQERTYRYDADVGGGGGSSSRMF